MSDSNRQNGSQSNGGNRPAKTIRYRAIQCTIWRNEGRNGPFYNTVITRSYKDGEEWRESSAFGQEDLPTVAKAALDAHTWIQEQTASEQQTAGNGGTPPQRQRSRAPARQPAEV